MLLSRDPAPTSHRRLIAFFGCENSCEKVMEIMDALPREVGGAARRQ